MKKRVFFFLFTVLVALVLAPMVNLLSVSSDARVPRSGHTPLRCCDRAFLYNLDVPLSWLSRILYPLGISIDSDQVIIGRDGWLYLGDKYNAIRTVDRRGETAADIALAGRIGEAATAWEQWLQQKGVRLYCVMVGPNKGTIYPEFLPHWAMPVQPSATDALMAGVRHDLYVDLRRVLSDAKRQYPETLYFQTDTHWNSIGAAVAFRAFAEHVHRLDAALRWPLERGIQVTRVAPRPGGDLARFLRLVDYLPDVNPIVQPDSGSPVKYVKREYAPEGIGTQDAPSAGVGEPPVQITSDRALNPRKVLWLRDSFGVALTPFMAATFTNIVYLPWKQALAAGGHRFIELVQSWKPDYVFVTAVERDARSELFANLPPSIVSNDRAHFSVRRGSSPRAVHDLVAGTKQGEWRIDGNDPFIDYTLSAPISGQEAPLLAFELSCDTPKEPVVLQVFWLKEGEPYFTESSSTRLTAKQGTIVIDQTPAPGWISASKITRVRFDIDSPQICSTFKISDLELGAVNISRNE